MNLSQEFTAFAKLTPTVKGGVSLPVTMAIKRREPNSKAARKRPILSVRTTTVQATARYFGRDRAESTPTFFHNATLIHFHSPTALVEGTYALPHGLR